MLNVVHNVQYFRWFERGRFEITDKVVPIRWCIEHKIAIPVVRNHCEYLYPATYGDELVVTTKHRISSRWTGTFTFEHGVSNAKTKIEVCQGWSEVTLVDSNTNRIIKNLPGEIWSRYQALA
jgi:YbgC/YbaW family acyl-CoA thioester hydrolase